MRFILVHGLGLSSRIWSSLTPLLPGHVDAVELAGHGGLGDQDYSWPALWEQVVTAMSPIEWSRTTLVLHSFSASLLPEIVRSGVEPSQVVLIEGILFPEADSWTERIAQLSPQAFSAWLEGFRSVAEMALKAQLVSRPSSDLIAYWAHGFQSVSGEALRQLSVNLCARVREQAAIKATSQAKFPITYVLGERTRLVCTKERLMVERGLSVQEVARSAHFPMIDNPKELADLITARVRCGLDLTSQGATNS